MKVEVDEATILRHAARYLRRIGFPDAAKAIDEVVDCKDRIGRHPIPFILSAHPMEEEDPREGKDWPPEEDCPGCDGKAGPEGPHRMACISKRVCLPVKGPESP